MINIIEAGEYVRTFDGNIAKCTEIDEYEYLFDKCINKYSNSFYECDLNESIKKHGKNIIDVLENKDTIYFKIKNFEHYDFATIRESEIIYRSGEKVLTVKNYNLKQIEIISVLTHEQYENNCYKLEEE